MLVKAANGRRLTNFCKAEKHAQRKRNDTIETFLANESVTVQLATLLTRCPLGDINENIKE